MMHATSVWFIIQLVNQSPVNHLADGQDVLGSQLLVGSCWAGSTAALYDHKAQWQTVTFALPSHHYCTPCLGCVCKATWL